MSDKDLTHQIANICKAEWVNLQALIDCSAEHLASSGSRPICQSITLLGRGSYNNVYRLVFDNGINLAASVSREREIVFGGAQAKESEIQTMKFVRESGLYPDIHVPKVHAWDTTYTNPVGSPYVLRDVVEGETVELENLTHVQQLAVIKALAKLKASLSRPVPFNRIGSIIADPSGGGQAVGPFFAFDDPRGPFESAHELWRFSLRQKILFAVQNWCACEKDEAKDELRSGECTPQEFTELFQMLSWLIPYFKIPKTYNHFVLHHPDIALRNVLFDKDSLSSDQPRITGLIDWDGAEILPFMLTAQYPGDLKTSGRDPFEHPNFSWNEQWRTVSFDWTSIGDPNQWPRAFQYDGKLMDFRPLASMNVRRYYLRAYFSACFAEEMYLLYGDAALPHATVYQDASYYLKFDEVVVSDWISWLDHAEWIRETYWRFRTLGGTRKTLGEDFLVTGPHIYLGSVERGLFNLGLPEESIPTVQVREDENDRLYRY